mmetsp:Transcript_3984/g.10075  ORF Transcript_3984/g.10075 Transcript_3984/m.10075 type:complete len:193 (-) Transcript_3984:230-808(-)
MRFHQLIPPSLFLSCLCIWLHPVHGLSSELGANAAIESKHAFATPHGNGEDFEVDIMRREKVVELKEKIILMGEFFSKHIEALAGDDPDNAPALRELVDKINSLDASNTTLESLVQFSKEVSDQAITQSANQAITMMSRTTNWEEIYNRRDTILGALIAAGKVNTEEAVLYQTDDDAWKMELFYIWDLMHGH